MMKKRVCALSLVWLVILSLFAAAPVSAAAESDVQLLADLGIIKPISHTGLIPKSYTRGDFAASLVYMDTTRPADWSTVTDDVSQYANDISGNENQNSIVEALLNGYMDTDENHCFRPGESLTMQDALAALVRILGYEPLVAKNGGSVSDYYQMATKIGLLRGVRANDERRLTWDDAARLLANAMGIRFYCSGSIVIEDACFYDYWDLTKHTGRILANSNLGLVVEKTPFRRVNIDGTIYETDLMIEDEMVGGEAVFYTRTGAQGTEVVSIYLKKNSDSVTIAAKDVEEVKNQGGYIEIHCRNNKTLRVDASGFVIVNGKTQTPTLELFQAFRSGSATFVDSDGDGSFDVVHMTLLLQGIIDGLSAELETMTLRYDNQKLNLKNVEQYEIYLNKKATGLEELKAGMPVGIACDAFTVGSSGEISFDFKRAERVVLYASSREESGVVASVSTDGISMDDIDIQFGEGYQRLISGGYITAPKPGDGVTLYLDSFGQLTYYKISPEASAMKYGYLIAAHSSKSGIVNDVKFKIMDANGRFHIYSAADKIILDGARMESGALQIDVSGQTADLTKRQVIRYRAENDMIREIDTAAVRAQKESRENTLSQDLAFNPYQSGGSQYRIRSGAVDRRFAFSKDCIVFVDEAGMEENNPAEFNFTVEKAADLPDEAYMAGYDANDVNEISCVVRYASYGRKEGDTVNSLYYYRPNGWVVEKVTKSVNKDGVSGFRLHLAGDNKKADYFAAEENLKLYVADQNNATGWQREYIQIRRVDAANLAQTVKSGDVIRFTTNAAGNITYIEKLFDFASHKDTLVEVPNAGGQVYGFVEIDKISGDNIIYHVDGSENYIFKKRHTTAPVYHVKTGKVTLESPENIPTASTGNHVKAFLRYYNYGTVYDHIFYLYD